MPKPGKAQVQLITLMTTERHLGEPVVHADSLEKLPGTVNGTEPSLMLIGPFLPFLQRYIKSLLCKRSVGLKI